MTTTGKNRIMIFGPKTDGTYVVEFRTGEGKSLAISIPRTETAVIRPSIEGFWSLIKRGIMGSFHKVSRKYLPLYVAEFQFRDNNRDNADIFGTAIAGC
jgi:hypothetical protein